MPLDATESSAKLVRGGEGGHSNLYFIVAAAGCQIYVYDYLDNTVPTTANCICI